MTIEQLFQYIIDNYCLINKKGYITFYNVTFEELKQELTDITENDFIALTNLIQSALRKDIKIYDGNLQLSQNQTLLQVDPAIDEIKYNELVDQAKEKFEEQTGVEIIQLGDNGKHICVEFNAQNLINFTRLLTAQQNLEQWVIDSCNNKIEEGFDIDETLDVLLEGIDLRFLGKYLD